MSQIEALIERIRARVLGLPPELRSLHRRILHHYAAHPRAPSLEALSGDSLGCTQSTLLEGLSTLHQADVLRLEGQKILCAYPFSTLSTRHHVLLSDGRQRHALCSTDALGIHAMLRQAIHTESRCPWCKTRIHVEVAGNEIRHCSHPDAIEFIPAGTSGCTSVSNTACP